ncbi:MAG: spermine synthase, partial [Planctomycetota bacterium]|nr:spermine synthase [Planctomycetota bacterium]
MDSSTRAIRWRTPSATFLMGFGGLLAQMVLLREILIVFNGNELCIGLALGNWLLLEAVGAYIGGRLADRARDATVLLVVLQLIFATAFVLAIPAVRIARTMLLPIHGQGAGVELMVGYSLAILAAVSIPHGALFPVCCRSGRGQVAAGRVEDAGECGALSGKIYAIETVGMIAAGLSFYYWTVKNLNSQQIAFAIAALNAVLSAFIALAGARRGKKALLFFSLLVTVGAIDGLAGGLLGGLHDRALATQWPGQRVLRYENSVYGNLAVTEKDGQYTVYSDGIPTVTLPVPDVIAVGEFAHFTLLVHPAPRDVLIISGGVGGLIAETLKHPDTLVTYTELDPLVMDLVRGLRL